MAALLFLLFLSILSTELTAAHTSEREDVIGQYALANEKQCTRLCWYRKLCTSYSYNSKPPSSPLMSAVYNCILHTDSVDSNRTETNVSSQATDWVESSISASPVNNGCKSRPCTRKEVCVPSSSILVSMSIEPTSHICLPACGVLPSISHGKVIASGHIEDDVADVKCDEFYVVSPRNASAELSCLVTSTWSSLDLECVQYKYESNDGSFIRLPWKLEENSKICIRGTLSQFPFSINLVPEPNEDNIPAMFWTQDQRSSFQFGWDIKKDGQWKNIGTTHNIQLNSGNKYNLSLHVLNSQMEVVLNDVTYLMPLDVSEANFIYIDTPGTLYINLISGC